MTQTGKPYSALLTSIDLMGLADSLVADRKYRKLVGAIRNYHAICSVRAALDRTIRLFEKSVELMDAATPPSTSDAPQDREKAELAGAVFSSALLAYVRATHTKSEIRNHTDFKDNIPESLKKAHQRVVDVRDNAIAHHGAAEWALRQPWIKEKTAWNFRTEDLNVFLASKSGHSIDGANLLQDFTFHVIDSNWMASILVDLQELLAVTPEIIKGLVDKRIADLEDAINATDAETDEFLGNAIRDNEFVAADFHESPEARTKASTRVAGPLGTQWQPDHKARDRSSRDAWKRDDDAGKPRKR